MIPGRVAPIKYRCTLTGAILHIQVPTVLAISWATEASLGVQSDFPSTHVGSLPNLPSICHITAEAALSEGTCSADGGRLVMAPGTTGPRGSEAVYAGLRPRGQHRPLCERTHTFLMHGDFQASSFPLHITISELTILIFLSLPPLPEFWEQKGQNLCRTA